MNTRAHGDDAYNLKASSGDLSCGTSPWKLRSRISAARRSQSGSTGDETINLTGHCYRSVTIVEDLNGMAEPEDLIG
jgi:hypothetical protein